MEQKDLFLALGLTPKQGALTAEQIKAVKALGALRDKRFEDVFNVRVITRNGKITADEARAIAEAADRFGSGEVAMTVRLTQEIQGVRYDDIPSLIFFLKDRGLETGGTGAKVRPIVSCKGTTCVFGLIDTFALSEKIHERFYVGMHAKALPHKFKIGVGGCPNNCAKPDLNDLGIIGQRRISVDTEKCRGCKKCAVETSCPMHAVTVRDGVASVDRTLCNNCSRCLSKCPFGAIADEGVGYKVLIGGRWGKNCERGRALSRLFTDEGEVLDVIERAILFYEKEGKPGERFDDTIKRIGLAEVEAALVSR